MANNTDKSTSITKLLQIYWLKTRRCKSRSFVICFHYFKNNNSISNGDIARMEQKKSNFKMLTVESGGTLGSCALRSATDDTSLLRHPFLPRRPALLLSFSQICLHNPLLLATKFNKLYI